MEVVIEEATGEWLSPAELSAVANGGPDRMCWLQLLFKLLELSSSRWILPCIIKHCILHFPQFLHHPIPQFQASNPRITIAHQINTLHQNPQSSQSPDPSNSRETPIHQPFKSWNKSNPSAKPSDRKTKPHQSKQSVIKTTVNENTHRKIKKNRTHVRRTERRGRINLRYFIDRGGERAAEILEREERGTVEKGRSKERKMNWERRRVEFDWRRADRAEGCNNNVAPQGS